MSPTTPDWRQIIAEEFKVPIIFETLIAFAVSLILSVILQKYYPSLPPKILPYAWIILTTSVAFFLVLVVHTGKVAIKARWIEHQYWSVFKTRPDKKTGRRINDYVYRKLSALIAGSEMKSNRVLFISPFSDVVKNDISQLQNLQRRFKAKIGNIEWYITNPIPEDTRNQLASFAVDKIAEAGLKIFLAGELPVFDKLLYVPGIFVLGFIGNTWLLWPLRKEENQFKDIEGKIALTPFLRKVDQFVKVESVHQSISCYLGKKTNFEEGFIIKGIYPQRLWISEPDKLFEKLTDYQGDMIDNFKMASYELRTKASKIVANLPLIGNYKAIIENEDTQEWLEQLRSEVDRRSTLSAERYIYISGKLQSGVWQFPNEQYKRDICEFLNKQEYFPLNQERYRIKVVLSNYDQLSPLYSILENATIEEEDYRKRFVSNWICFSFQGDYHVLQYEAKLNIDPQVAYLIARCEFSKELIQKLQIDSKVAPEIATTLILAPGEQSNLDLQKEYLHNKEFSEEKVAELLFLSKKMQDAWESISLFMFIDSFDPNETSMRYYLNFVSFLKRLSLDTTRENYGTYICDLKDFLHNWGNDSR